MGSLPLLAPLDAGRDRALGLLHGAIQGARAARAFAGQVYEPGAWVRAEAVVLHAGRALVETGRLEPHDLIRRLIRQWVSDLGRPWAVHRGEGQARGRGSGDWVAALGPSAIVHLMDRREAQVQAAELGKAFQAAPAEVEALELISVFVRRSLLTGRACLGLAPVHWEGDPRVAAVAAGESLPLNTERDLVSATDQAFTLAARRVHPATAFAALASVNASDPAFILTGMLIGASQGRCVFINAPAATRTDPRIADALDALGDALLTVQRDRDATQTLRGTR